MTFSKEPPSSLRYNSLLSAQCKARCLYEYRNQHQHQQRSIPANFNQGKTKRLLTNNALTLPWRSIWERCPRLSTCSSCLVPCDLDPPLLLSSEQSCQAICSTFENGECQRSCQFIQNLYQQSPNCLTGDCQSTSLCSSSDDCLGKLPQPGNVVAVERKSRRTVKLKWTVDGVLNTEPVFYVIEAQWKLKKTKPNEQETLSKWGFLKEEVSHTKAIIRNIQRDERWYTFRVAAVTRHGYSQFSTTDKPFRLSSESKNDSELSPKEGILPRNFSIKDVQPNSNSINITVQWQESDLSVNGYQISWQADDDPSALVNTIDLSSSIYPLEMTIPYLSMHTTYLFKVRSMINTDGNDIQTSESLSIKFNYEETLFNIDHFRMSEPYFINGLIKANISWKKVSNERLQQYDLYWTETQCYSDVLSCCYSRDAVTIENTFQLYDLRFNCTYILKIQPVISKMRLKKSFEIQFNVSSCQSIEVLGSIRPPCQTVKSARISSSPLNLLVQRNQSGIDISWFNVSPLNTDGTGIYHLRIEQLPDRLKLMSVDLSPTITNYFFAYPPQTYRDDQKTRYLNITVSLIDHSILHEQQSTIIEEFPLHYRSNWYTQLNLISSSNTIRLSLLNWIVILSIINKFL